MEEIFTVFRLVSEQDPILVPMGTFGGSHMKAELRTQENFDVINAVYQKEAQSSIKLVTILKVCLG